MFSSNLIAIVIAMVVTLNLTESEAGQCRFKFENEDNDIICRSYTHLPTDIPLEQRENIKRFELLFDSNIPILKNGSLMKTGLKNLERIMLNACQIKTIEQGAFAGGDKIVSLDLSGNLLNYLDPTVFSDLPKLMYLWLEFNPIKQLKAPFPRLPSLTHLSLGYCNLTSIDSDMFTNLNRLTSLDLSGNELSSPPTTILKNIHSVQIVNNPFLCDCNLKKFITENSDFAADKLVYSCFYGGKKQEISEFVWSLSCNESESHNETTGSNPNCKFDTIGNLGIISCHSIDSINTSLLTNIYEKKRLNVSILEMTGHIDLPILQNQTLFKTGLLNLTTIVLDSCKIQTIELGAFIGLIKITSVFLSYNLLEFLDPTVFTDLPNLDILVLRGNPIKNFKAPFPILPSLTDLDLSTCQIHSIDTYLFTNLKNLTKLDLSFNQLTSLSAKTFQNLTKIRSLNVNFNPFQCNCQLKQLLEFIDAFHIDADLETRTCYSGDKEQPISEFEWDTIVNFSCNQSHQETGEKTPAPMEIHTESITSPFIGKLVGIILMVLAVVIVTTYPLYAKLRPTTELRTPVEMEISAIRSPPTPNYQNLDEAL